MANQGRSFAEGARVLKDLHPDKAQLIDAFGARFDEMIASPVAGSVEILQELRERKVPLYALSNWPAEAFLLARFPIDPMSAIFIDDSEVNAAAARSFGIHAIHFTNPAGLRAELVALGLL